jgi:hypothetical protein|nr:MAG TPA: hypothetical protein [Caudoviricetes sp.]
MSMLKGFISGLAKTAAKLLVVMTTGIVAERVLSKIPGLHTEESSSPEESEDKEDSEPKQESVPVWGFNSNN